jgi:hypothetical protein
MRKSLIGMAAVLFSGVMSAANDKTPAVQEVIHTAPENIKKAALSMFVSDGYTIDTDNTALLARFVSQAYKIDSNKTSVLRISRPWSSEETSNFNTEHWTNKPVSNCRHVLALILSPEDQATNVTMRLGTECHADGSWLLMIGDDEKDVQWMQTTLANLKAKIEGAYQRH